VFIPVIPHICFSPCLLKDGVIEDPERLHEFHQVIGQKIVYGNCVKPSSLTQKEVTGLLTEGIIPTHRREDEVISVINFQHLAKLDLSGPIDVEMVKSIHSTLSENISDAKPGVFRDVIIRSIGLYRSFSPRTALLAALHDAPRSLCISRDVALC
jgi:hypothetical protein